MQRQLYIRRGYKFKLSWEYCLLEPMDTVTLTDLLVGLNNTPVRITDISEDDQGLLDITAEEFPNGVATAVEYPVQVKSSNGIAASAPAPAINAPLIFEPPYQLAGELAVWIAASPAQNGQSWGGCNVFVSLDNDSFVQIPTPILGESTMGSLTAPLPTVVSNSAGAAVLDGVNTLSVDLRESVGELSSVSAQGLTAGASSAFVGLPPTGEIISYQNATLTQANEYSLAPLMRGLFGSTIEAHNAGELFAFLGGNIFKQTYQPDQIGQTLYFKFQSFNTLGGGLQPIEDCATYSYTLTGLGLAGPVAIPQNLRLAFDNDFAELTWDTVNDSRGQVTYVIKQGPTASTAQTVGSTILPPFKVTTPGTYWVFASVTPIPNVTLNSQASSSVALTSNMIVTNLLEEIDEQANGWEGALVNLSLSGSFPAQQLVLGQVTSVDFGTTDASDPVTMTDDFGTTDDDVITVLDLGTV
ncbi:MAG: phage tail protein [Methylovirgula sp.]